MPTSDPRHLAIYLFDDVEELDAVGPYEVLANWTTSHPEDGYRVVTVSDDGAAVRAAKGLVLGADARIDEAPPLAAFIHPGGRGTRRLLAEANHLAWLRARRSDVPLLASVCTGSLVYAAAGLLAGRPATTHWSTLDLLAELDPTIEVRGDARFVDDGDVLTSAGVSAGIDMALHLVARLAGAPRAAEVRRAIDYAPGPA